MHKYLYHGSDRKLNIGDKLLCHTSYNKYSTEKVHACFATSSIAKAKYFGIINCIRPRILGARSCMDNNKLYITDVAPVIKPKFYVYMVDFDDFVLDAKNEYMSDHDVLVRDIVEFDLVDTLNRDGLEVYQVPHTDKSLPVSEQIEQLQNFIYSGQAYRLDIAELIKNHQK